MKPNLLLATLLSSVAIAANAADAPGKTEKDADAPKKAGQVELAYDYANLDANKDGYVSPEEMNEHDRKRNAAKAAK